jgi:hypothetical protein
MLAASCTAVCTTSSSRACPIIQQLTQLTRRAEPTEQAAYARLQVALLRQFLPSGGHYVEIGAGDCATVCRVAAFARAVTAVRSRPTSFRRACHRTSTLR